MSLSPQPSDARRAPRVLVIGCGALVRELHEATKLNGGTPFEVQCLPAKLHNRPEQIVPALRERLRAARASGDWCQIIVGYMDCGTGGDLDRLCAAEGVARLPGVHCYEMYAGASRFAALHDAEPGTFYLTDYLVRHFERLIIDGLGIADHPQLLDVYFGNYTRVVHLAQSDDPDLTRRAEQAAARLGLRCERIFTGIGALEHELADMAQHPSAAPAEPRDARPEPVTLRTTATADAPRPASVTVPAGAGAR